MALKDTATRVGEVVAASTAEFTAHCYQLYGAPPLGSLVKTANPPIDIYGVACDTQTHSVEPGRPVVARGEKEESEEDILRHHPHITKLLRTQFKALVVGYQEGNQVHRYLPPQAARLHSFAYLCSRDEARAFSNSLNFLSLLVDTRLPVPVDDVVAACLRHLSRAHPDPDAFLIKAGRELALLLSGEMRRLNSILRKLKA